MPERNDPISRGTVYCHVGNDRLTPQGCRQARRRRGPFCGACTPPAPVAPRWWEPPPGVLPAPAADGRVCLWCGAPLTPATKGEECQSCRTRRQMREWRERQGPQRAVAP